MQSDINGCSTIDLGQEQYEEFKSYLFKGTRVQYDYRTQDGKLFSCIAKDLKSARRKRNKWLRKEISSVYVEPICNNCGQPLTSDEAENGPICEECKDLEKTMSEANTAYKNRREDVNVLLDMIVTDGIPMFDDKQALDPDNWGFAGTMAQIIENLVTIAFTLEVISADEARALTGIEY